ncbi:hypothetical protein GlitD10_1218 [Gloeomargarita lithophora Alchichica-D10]|uniref:PIN domain-containing protein n=1 Tax=Gloeomargarita lithophora Alchichica-D10 TaxID=1188229 RepID=A0A1J0AC88_9CYAN|nr:PIN domain-containing protein [Gloeomargarita lithophora]APB33538.1 hypothetical protein GlitD10_1218 [Gloeomargarita lithophora Alchichica-D10]
MRRILFDSDILLDVLAERQPFMTHSAQALDQATQPHIRGYIAGHAVTNIFYILRRHVGHNTARKMISQLLLYLRVADVTEAVIRVALDSPMQDFEDAVTSAAAHAIGTERIISRNIADFSVSLVPAVAPIEFLAMLSQ